MAENAGAPKYKGVVTAVFFIFSIFCCFITSATGVLGIMSSNSINDTAMIFVGLYMILFSAILFSYELCQLRPDNPLDNILKQNVGFLYGPIGRGSYILFMGLLSFGVTDPRNLAIATGVLVGLWGCIVIGITAALPSYFDKKQKYTPVTTAAQT